MTSIVSNTLQITVNGAPLALAKGAMVTDLIATLVLDPREVAIEHNQAIVPRSAYATTALTAGDRIEIVSFIGGG